MKKIILLFLVGIVFLNPFIVSASSVVIDMDSGRVLYEYNKDEKKLIASITKIMTAVIAIENSNLNDVVVVGDEVLSMYGSNIYLEVGEEITLRDLIYGLILRSGNDAAVAIAKYVSGSIEKFVLLMNKKASEIGMKNTIFNNPHGLDEESQNYSSAYDMALLMKYASNLMDFVIISGTKKWSCSTNKKSYVWYNRNKLLTEYKYATGGKTGYTPKAGKTLVSTASKNNLNLIAVSIKDDNHYNNQIKLYEDIFSKYKRYLIIDKNNFNISNKFYNSLYVDTSFYYPMKEDELDKIKVNLDLYELSNYSSNQKVGEIYVMFDNNEIFRENVYVINASDKNISIINKILSFFNSLFT